MASLARRELRENAIYGGAGVAERQTREIGDGEPGDFHRQALGTQPLALARGAE